MLRRNLIIAGMFVLLGSIAALASAQGPRGGGFGGGGLFGGGAGNLSGAMLLRMPEVQTELNLTEDQKSQLQTIATSVQEKVRASIGQFNFQDFQNLSDEERQKRIADMRKKAEEATKGVEEKVTGILDAKQNARLKELQLQREGAQALTRPEVIKKLNITEEQQATIKKIQEDARPKGNLFDPSQSQEERQASFKKMRDQMEKAQKDCLAVLNDDQMLEWTTMCGKTFKFPEFQMRQRTRPGGGNNPPPQ